MDVITFVQLDLPAIVVGMLAAISCGLLGNFLVLRRQALVGDAISHVVLPGIVVGFLVAGEISTWPMMGGAAAAALLAVLLIEVIRRLGGLEPGAAMGVVFTAMFALGVLLLEQTGARGVHLDVRHALYGNLEATLWLDATGWQSLVDPAALAGIPASIGRLAVVTALVILLITLFFKELKISTFDPGFAISVGVDARPVSIGLIVMVAITAVAAFDAVGSILVIAMFICPAATARMLTDNLRHQLWLSALVAGLSGVCGYILAAFGPGWLGLGNAVGAAGMIAVVAGLFQAAAMLLAPRYGWLVRRLHQAESAPHGGR